MDLSKLSDEELLKLAAESQPSAPDDLSKLSDEELLKLAGQSAPVSEKPMVDSGVFSAKGSKPSPLQETVGNVLRSGIAGHFLGLDQLVSPDTEERKAWKAEHPVLDVGAQVVGGLIPSPVSVAGKVGALAKAGGAAVAGLLPEAAAVAPGVVSGASGLISKIGSKLPGVVSGATEGAISGAGALAASSLGQKQVPTAEDVATGIGAGAGIGALVPIAGPLLSKSSEIIAKSGKRGFSLLTGIPENLIDSYLERLSSNAGKTLDNVPTRAELQDYLESLQRNVVSKKDSIISEFDNTINSLKSSAESHANAAKEAASVLKNELKNASISEDYSAKVLESVKRLKNLGIEASNRGFEQLEKQNPGKLFPKEFITNQISKAMDSLVDKEIGSLDDTAIKEIGKLQEKALKFPEVVSLTGVKKLLQYLDNKIEYQKAGTVGGFMTPESKALYSVRKALDTELKAQVPGYGKAMQDASSIFNLLEKTGDIASDKSVLKITGLLSGKQEPYYKELLGELGKKTDTNLLYDPYVVINKNKGAAKVAPDLSKSEEILSEIKKLKERGPVLGEDIEKLSGVSPEQARNLVDIRARDPQKTIKTVEALDRAAGTEGTAQKIQDRVLLDALQKPTTNGSRKTLFGSVIGSLFGGPVGTAIGAASGYSLDEYGRRAGKKLLELYAQNKPITMGMINKLNLSKENKDGIIRMLQAAGALKSVEMSKDAQQGISEVNQLNGRFRDNNAIQRQESKPITSEYVPEDSAAKMFLDNP